MTLETLLAGIGENYRTWATEYVAQLDAVGNHEAITKVISRLLEQAVKHPAAASMRDPIQAVKAALRLAGRSNFRLGLLVGLLLWRPAEEANTTPVQELLIPIKEEVSPQAAREACELCLTTGTVCHDCGKSLYDCGCGLGNYSPVVCMACNGQGYQKLTN